MVKYEITYGSIFYYIAAVWLSMWAIFATVLGFNRLQALMYDSVSGKAVLFAAFLAPALALYVWMKRQNEIRTPWEFLCRMTAEKGHAGAALIAFAFCLGQLLLSVLSGHFRSGQVGTAVLYAAPALFLEGFQETGFRGFLAEAFDGEIPFGFSAVLIGTLWGLLFFPLWLIEGTPWRTCSFLFFFLNCVFRSIVLNALYLMTGSVAACVALRTFFIMLSCMFDGLMFDNGAYTIFASVEMILVFVIVCRNRSGT